MASTYTPLGVELQATGENAGTWGTKTNTSYSNVSTGSNDSYSDVATGSNTSYSDAA